MSPLRRAQRWATKPHKPSFGTVAFSIVAVASFVAGLSLLFGSNGFTTGPATAVIYGVPENFGLPGRETWGVAGVLLGLVSAYAARFPSRDARRAAYTALLGASVSWAIGFTFTFFGHHVGTFWGPLLWWSIFAITATALWLIPLNSPIYGPQSRHARRR